MDREYIIKLTLAVYRVTELFPEKEPLKNKIRELSLKILGDILDSKRGEIEQVMKDIERLEDFLEIAKSQNWVDFRNFLVLNQEYVKIRKGIIPKEKLIEEKSKELPKKAKIAPRQKKILEFLQKQEKTQVWELQKLFPGISKRTLRRDLENLLNQGVIERIGKWNETFYRLKTV
ncbi:hypothetical protein AMJ49_04290 [Parcubacteria bacterium DG_74_2]|nr:MAG: hypothetical protein AMJ49_04290 [Parcubacteria bacterium DG_74_2]